MNDVLWEDVSDPTDWTGDWSALRPLDESLRCGLCYDIFRAPVALRECSHLFCSSCIRIHINQAGGNGSFCPQCRQKKAYDSELIAQPALEATAEHWRKARTFLMAQSKHLKELETSIADVTIPQLLAPEKAKRPAEESPSGRQLRPRKRVAGTPDMDEETDLDYRHLKEDTIVACPICQRTFDALALNAHLDRGCGADTPEASTSRPSQQNWLATPHSIPTKRLTRPQYQLKSERDLRKMLEACKLPTTGPKERLVERHRQWVNMYNANLDAAPALRESLPALRKQLQKWESAQNNAAASKGVSTEKQARAWLKSNQTQYADLAAQARASLQRAHTKKSDTTAPPTPPSSDRV